MNYKIPLFIILFFSLFCLSSCVEVTPPEVEFIDHAIRNIALDGFDAVFFFEASNSNPVSIGIKKYSYKIFLNDQEFLSDERKGFKIPASGKKKFEIKTRIRYENILKTTASVIGTLLSGEEEIPYRIEGRLSGEVGGIIVTAPLEAEGTITVKIPTK